MLNLLFLPVHCSVLYSSLPLHTSGSYFLPAHPEPPHMAAKSTVARQKADHLNRQSSVAPHGSTVDPDNLSCRPIWSNHGQGGHVKKLTTFAQKLTDKKQMGSKTPASKELPANAPINTLALPEKKR